MSRTTERTPVELAITALMRSDSGRVIAILTRKFRDLDLADECVQEAFTEAATNWPTKGIPDNPPAWLLTVARNRAIDRLRRANSAKRRLREAAPDLIAQQDDIDSSYNRPTGPAMIDESNDPRSVAADEDQLRLVLLCCHPALDRDAQIALTLKLVGGLTTPEIAAAFLLPEPTLAQRIVRAKRKIRDANIPLSMPDKLDARLDVLLGVLFLIFNEGYLPRGDTDAVTRVDLADEAIRLTRLVTSLAPASTEAIGLLALELFSRSRWATRANGEGDLVLLEDQDRSQWDLGLISEANTLVTDVMRRQQPGPFQMQAVIAAYHANARTAADTDWPTIAQLYNQLRAMTSSPVVALNHAVAVAMADGPLAGLALLDRITGIEQYHLLHATRGELLVRAGRAGDAIEHFARARTLTDNPVEQRHLDRRRAACLA
jgi:RNA polymerase sigma-70 factor, ECF subfamily